MDGSSAAPDERSRDFTAAVSHRSKPNGMWQTLTMGSPLQALAIDRRDPSAQLERVPCAQVTDLTDLR